MYVLPYLDSSGSDIYLVRSFYLVEHVADVGVQGWTQIDTSQMRLQGLGAPCVCRHDVFSLSEDCPSYVPSAPLPSLSIKLRVYCSCRMLEDSSAGVIMVI